MEFDPAPIMANPFLYHFESKWINLKKENLQIARRFSNTFRFIDGLLTINENDRFHEKSTHKNSNQTLKARVIALLS